ncbi:MAG: allantoate amidohydrolase [Pirellulaceae bacterium]|nr:allantoate amidohydrolase [Pirellulaceae bacterium]
MPDFSALAAEIMQRCDQIAAHSELPGKVCRTFCSPATAGAVQLVKQWMCAAGLTVQLDAACNVIGRSAVDQRPALLIGSHIDTVPDGGRFDGALGIMFAIAAAQMFQARSTELPFTIQAIAFSEEEGVRFRTPYIGSRALAGCFDLQLLERTDNQGIPMWQAMQSFGGQPENIAAATLPANRVLAFLEPHIEQGPVLETSQLAVGLVDGIAGQTRATARFVGRAAHAGTTPMHLRADALAAAAQWILAVEQYARDTPGLVATIGYAQIHPNTPNVIAGEVVVRLDARHQLDTVRHAAAKHLQAIGQQVASSRGLAFHWEDCQEQAAVALDSRLIATLESACHVAQQPVLRLTSGAGHDAVVMSRLAPTAMLFLRCKHGISHHPDESVQVSDVEAGLRVMYHFIDLLAAAFRNS